MAHFRCIRSGNMVEFKGAYDIDCMRKQILDYVEVDESGNPLKEEDKVHFKNDSKDLIERNKAARRKALEEAAGA
jgi:hypothetical protein